MQTFVDSSEHSYLGDATYPALFDALLAWVERGEKPTPKWAAASRSSTAMRAVSPLRSTRRRITGPAARDSDIVATIVGVAMLLAHG